MYGFKFILDNPQIKWNWYCISKHHFITWEFIISNIDKYPWNSQGIAENPNVTFQNVVDSYNIIKDKICMYTINKIKYIDFSKNCKEYIVSYDLLSMNPFLDFTFVDNNKDEEWNWKELSKHPNIPSWFVKKYFDRLYFNKLIKNIKFVYDDLLSILSMTNGKERYNFYNISKNPNFTIEWYKLLNKFNININVDQIVQHRNISWNDIIEHNLFSSKYISKNSNITIENIVSNLNFHWDWQELSKHPNISWEFIYDTRYYFPWVWQYVTFNPNIRWDIVKHNQEFDWNWEYIFMKFVIPESDLDLEIINFEFLSANPMINWSIIKKFHTKKWNWDYLVTNSMILNF